jgi:hypothetical protein
MAHCSSWRLMGTLVRTRTADAYLALHPKWVSRFVLCEPMYRVWLYNETTWLRSSTSPDKETPRPGMCSLGSCFAAYDRKSRPSALQLTTLTMFFTTSGSSSNGPFRCSGTRVLSMAGSTGSACDGAPPTTLDTKRHQHSCP